MMTGNQLCLPKLLEDRDVKSWFKQYKLCVAANKWSEEKNFFDCQSFSKDVHGQCLSHWVMMTRTHMHSNGEIETGDG